MMNKLFINSASQIATVGLGIALILGVSSLSQTEDLERNACKESGQLAQVASHYKDNTCMLYNPATKYWEPQQKDETKSQYYYYVPVATNF